MSAYANSYPLAGKSRLVGGRGAAAVVLLLLAMGLAYWVWFGLTQGVPTPGFSTCNACGD